MVSLYRHEWTSQLNGRVLASRDVDCADSASSKYQGVARERARPFHHLHLHETAAVGLRIGDFDACAGYARAAFQDADAMSIDMDPRSDTSADPYATSPMASSRKAATAAFLLVSSDARIWPVARSSDARISSAARSSVARISLMPWVLVGSWVSSTAAAGSKTAPASIGICSHGRFFRVPSASIGICSHGR